MSRVVSLPADGRTIRGYSAPRLIVVDEAAFVPDETQASIRPMLATGGGQLILLSTPFGRRGAFFEAWQNGGEAWERISVPAVDCPRISREFLEQERAVLPDHRFRSEYECAFVENDDALFAFDVLRAALDPTIEPIFSPIELARLSASATQELHG